MRGGLALCLALALSLGQARAADVLTVQTLPIASAKPGTTVQARFQITVKPGYHVQANPVENPNLIPITVKVDPGRGVRIGEPVYPNPKRMRLPGDIQDMVIYDGAFAVALPLMLPSDASAGETISLQGSLRYQACDDSHCLFPVNVPFALHVTIADR
jgi:DsbC/DsbD-like thiol-disulfide interchange protein